MKKKLKRAKLKIRFQYNTTSFFQESPKKGAKIKIIFSDENITIFKQKKLLVDILAIDRIRRGLVRSVSAY